MEMGLRGVVALVAASSQGIGKAIALGLAAEGASVSMCARNAGPLEAAAREVRSTTGAEVFHMPADVSRADEISALVRSTVDHFGHLEVLVTNAGGPPPGEFQQHGDDAWQRVFELNLMSTIRLIRGALPHLKASGRGRIINITSSSVKQPIEGLILSNSMRLGVVGLAKTLATELGPHGITVNNIAPSRIATQRVRDLDAAHAAAQGTTEEEVRQKIQAHIPLGRYGSPQEVANLAVFLASDKASYITGTTIQVDGGLVKAIF